MLNSKRASARLVILAVCSEIDFLITVNTHSNSSGAWLDIVKKCALHSQAVLMAW